MLSAQTTAFINKAAMLSVEGRCKTLDSAADGYVRGESCVAHQIDSASSNSLAYVKPLGAILVRGSGVNQDGRSSSLTAPHGPSQQLLLQATLLVASVDASDVDVLELHGTGTSLGDPIEVGAALSVLRNHSTATAKALELQAVKSSLAHTEPAAGALGMVFAAKVFQLCATQEVLHLRSLNSHVTNLLQNSLLKGAAALCTRRGSALPAVAVITGISSFAYMGTNAHVTLGTKLVYAESWENTSSWNWRQSRFWYSAPVHPMLRVAYTHVPQLLQFDMAICAARLFFLHDVQVKCKRDS